MSFLTGLGSLAGGFSQSFFPYQQQYNENVATGQGIAALAGVQLPNGGGMGNLQGGMQALFTPPPQQGSSQLAPPQQQVTAPQQQAPTQIPQPTQQPTPTGVSRPPLPVQQPQVAQPGSGLPQQSQSVPPTAPSQPTGTAALASQPQQAPPPQQFQQRPQQQDMSRFSGMFDLPTITARLARTPGMTNEKLGRIFNSRGFENMLNQQGLAQYRAMQGQLGAARIGLGEERLSQQADEFARREGRLSQNETLNRNLRETLAKYQPAVQAINKDAQSKIAAINAAVARGDMDQKEADQKIQQLNQDRDKRLEDAVKQYLPEVPKESEGGGDQQGAPELAHDAQGNTYKYKGSGDRNDMKNWEKVGD